MKDMVTLKRVGSRTNLYVTPHLSFLECTPLPYPPFIKKDLISFSIVIRIRFHSRSFTIVNQSTLSKVPHTLNRIKSTCHTLLSILMYSIVLLTACSVPLAFLNAKLFTLRNYTLNSTYSSKCLIIFFLNTSLSAGSTIMGLKSLTVVGSLPSLFKTFILPFVQTEGKCTRLRHWRTLGGEG